MSTQNEIGIQKNIDELEKIINNPPSDDAEIIRIANQINQLATSEQVQFDNIKIQNIEETIKKIEAIDENSPDLFSLDTTKLLSIIDRIDDLRTGIREDIVNEFKTDASKIDKAFEKFLEEPSPVPIGEISAQISRADLTVIFLPQVIDAINNSIAFFGRFNKTIVTGIDDTEFTIPAIRVSNVKVPVPDPFVETQNPYDIKDKFLKLKYSELPNYLDNIKQYHDDLVSYRSDPKTLVPHLKAGDFVFGITKNQKNKLINELTTIIQQAIDYAEIIVDEYIKTIGQKGGTMAIKNRILRSLYVQLLLERAKQLLDHYRKKIQIVQQQATEQQATGQQPEQQTYQQDTTDYTTPLISLLMYKMGSFNNYDTRLAEYCQAIGLDTNATLGIYLALNRNDIQQILVYYNKFNSANFMNILRLKKLSAEKKFRTDYGVSSNDQVGILMSKFSMWQ